MYILIGILVFLAILIYCIDKDKKKSSITRRDKRKENEKEYKNIVEKF